MQSNEYIEELKKLIENVESSNNSPVYILCCKEYEEELQKYFKRVMAIPDRLEVKDTIYIIPIKEK